MQTLLTMCWSLPTIFAIILKMTKQAFAGVTTSEKTRRARKGETMLMTAWLTCWRVIETFSDIFGNWILCHTKSAGNKRHAHQRNNRKRAGCRPRGTAFAMTVLAMQANATIATERKTQAIRHGFRNDRNRQPMFGVYIPLSRQLCGRAQTN